MRNFSRNMDEAFLGPRRKIWDARGMPARLHRYAILKEEDTRTSQRFKVLAGVFCVRVASIAFFSNDSKWSRQIVGSVNSS